MDVFKRVKIRTGFFRMVALSEKEKGFDTGYGGVVGYRPTQEEIASFTRFFDGDPRLV